MTPCILPVSIEDLLHRLYDPLDIFLLEVHTGFNNHLADPDSDVAAVFPGDWQFNESMNSIFFPFAVKNIRVDIFFRLKATTDSPEDFCSRNNDSHSSVAL